MTFETRTEHGARPNENQGSEAKRRPIRYKPRQRSPAVHRRRDRQARWRRPRCSARPGGGQGAVAPTPSHSPNRSTGSSRPCSAGYSRPGALVGKSVITEGSDGKALLSVSIGAAGLQQNAAGAPTRQPEPAHHPAGGQSLLLGIPGERPIA